MDNFQASEDLNREEARLWKALLKSIEGEQGLNASDNFNAALAEGLRFVQQSVDCTTATDPNQWYLLRKLAIWHGISADLIHMDAFLFRTDNPIPVLVGSGRKEPFPAATLQIIDHLIVNLEASQRIIPDEDTVAKLEGSRLLSEVVALRGSEVDLYRAFEILEDAVRAAFGNFWLCDISPARTPAWLEVISALCFSAVHFSSKLKTLGAANVARHLYRQVGLMRWAAKLARYHDDGAVEHEVQVAFSRKLIKLSEYHLEQLANIPPDDFFNNEVCCETAIRLCREATKLFGNPHESYNKGDLGRLRAGCGVGNRASLCRALLANWQLRGVRRDLEEAFQLTTDLFKGADLGALVQVMDLKEYHEKLRGGLIDHPNYAEHLDQVICVYEAIESLWEAIGYNYRSNLAEIRVKARVDLSILLRKRFSSNGRTALGDITCAIDILEAVLISARITLPQTTSCQLQLAHCYELKSALSFNKEDQHMAITILEDVLNADVPKSISDRCHILIQLARNLIQSSDIAIAHKEPGAAEANIVRAITYCEDVGHLNQGWTKRYTLHMLGQCFQKRFELNDTDNTDQINRSINYLEEALKWGRPWPERDGNVFEMPTVQDILSFVDEMRAKAAASSQVNDERRSAKGGVYYSNSPDSKSLMLTSFDDLTSMLNSNMSDWSNAAWNDIASAYEIRSSYNKSSDVQRQSDRQTALYFVGKCVNNPACELRTRLQAYVTASKVHFACGQWKETVASSRQVLILTQKLPLRSSSYADQINASSTHGLTMPRAVSAALLAGSGSDEALRLMEQGRGLFASFPLAARIDITNIDRQQAFNYIQVRSRFDTLRASLNNMERGTALWVTASNQCVQAEKELQDVIERIDAVRDILGPPSMREVREALGDNTLVILNTSEARCDAFLITNKNSEIETLELCKLKHEEVDSWAKRLQDNRPSVSISMLSWLWETVAQPILQALGFSNPSSKNYLPRIHWILTGRMTHMPVHAAGLYTSEHRGKATTVMDCAVSSYTSSLKMYVLSRTQRQTLKVKKTWTAEEIDAMDSNEWHANSSPNRVFNETENGYVLLEAEDIDTVAPKAQQKALLVGMGTTSYRPRGRGLERLPFAATEVDELEEVCKSLFDPENVAVFHQANQKAILDRVSECTVFHFAGHGQVDTAEPSNSALMLEDGPLTVSDLLECKLHGHVPFLGFLSACKTGTSDKAGLEDEGIHLIGAFQLAGFRHVVGTMWQVYDQTCLDAAKSLYAELVENGITDDAVCRGLHKAVVKLRDKWLEEIGSEEMGVRDASLRKSRKTVLGEDWDTRARWVPFIHYGP